LNSEKLIRHCLESVKDFNEIIICDMYSSDRTLAIAREYGCTVVMHEPCNGIPEPARAFAVKQATCDWVLVVDSDEVVPQRLKTYLYDKIKSPSCPDALYIPRRNFFMNRFMHASFPDYQLRFFRKEAFAGWPVTIHARPEINGRIGKAPKQKELALVHLEANDISATLSKTNTYSDREVERRKDENVSVAGLALRPLYRFLQMYLFNGGYRDGKAGFIHALLHTFYKYLTLAKIIEKRQVRPD
jgi:glycosyltransferase involved in cell wall biosynthesis